MPSLETCLTYEGWDHEETGARGELRAAAMLTHSYPVEPGSSVRGPDCNWAELHQLTLQMAAASRPSAQERAGRARSSAVMVLGCLAGVLAAWDLSVLVRGAG
jgi:hypothetical protein